MTEQISGGRRGRPRTFDLAAAIEAAQDVFWRRGLDASLDEVAAAMGLHRPSVYAAFGDKHRLYLAALDAYLRCGADMVREAVAEPTLRASLARFYGSDLETFSPAGGRGCFMLTTALPAAALHPDVAERVVASLNALQEALRRRLSQAKSDGDGVSGLEIEAATEIAFGLHCSLSARARAGRSRNELEHAIAKVLDVLCPRTPPT